MNATLASDPSASHHGLLSLAGHVPAPAAVTPGQGGPLEGRRLVYAERLVTTGCVATAGGAASRGRKGPVSPTAVPSVPRAKGA